MSEKQPESMQQDFMALWKQLSPTEKNIFVGKFSFWFVSCIIVAFYNFGWESLYYPAWVMGVMTVVDVVWTVYNLWYYEPEQEIVMEKP